MSEAKEVAIPRSCQNCAAALSGPYCGFCGQRALRLDVSLRELLHEGFHEFVHLDGRILLTLRLLFTRPGRLTAEMLAGRRQRYIAPIRLYLVASVLFFLTLAAMWPMDKLKVSVSGTSATAAAQTDDSWDQRIRRGMERANKDRRAFTAAVWSRAPKAAFLMVPAFGLLTMALFRRRMRFFVPHLYFALHFHTFVFLLAVLLMACGRWVSPALALPGLLVAPVYLVAAARTTFDTGWLEAALKSVLVLACYGLLLTTTVMAVIVLTVMFF
jgi:hypothetical protein